jgi:hypothetical protein
MRSTIPNNEQERMNSGSKIPTIVSVLLVLVSEEPRQPLLLLLLLPELAAPELARGRRVPPPSNPYEFYYYSGFGPLWARKRGDRGLGGAADASKSNEAAKLVDSMTINTTRSSTPSSSSQIDNNNDDFDYVDDDDDDDEDDANGDSGKKRMRKPVKARSLKSLM